MPKPEVADPLRARIAAILEAARGEDWECNEDGDEFPVDRFDPDKAADALAALVGPLVAACREMLIGMEALIADGGGHYDEVAARRDAEILRAALAAIDGAEGEGPEGSSDGRRLH